MKCLVAIAVSREWSETEFLMQLGTWQMPTAWQVRFGFFRQFSAAERHNVMLGETVFHYDRVIFMDTDQVYPPDYLMEMLKHDEPVVTALNVSRYYPFEHTIYNVGETKEKYGMMIPDFVPVTPPTDRRIFECDVTGTGAMMIDPRALADIPRPFFKDVFEPDGCVRLIPDDFYFGLQLHKAGIKVTVDQGIIIKHLAKILVAPYNALHMRKAWEAVNSGFGTWKDGRNQECRQATQ